MPLPPAPGAGETYPSPSIRPGARAERRLKAYLARRLCRATRRLAANPVLTPDAAAEDVHALRKRVRRARYNAEFATPVLGRPARKLALRLKLLADALGDIHDLDVHLHRLAWHGRQPPGALAALIREDRARAWRNYGREWRRLTGKNFGIRRLKGIR
jgi:CHAD domain-containing protein